MAVQSGKKEEGGVIMNIFIGKQADVLNPISGVNLLQQEDATKGTKNAFKWPAQQDHNAQGNSDSKKTLLQRKALKVVLNQLQNDGQIDQKFQEHMDRQKELVQETGKAQEQINRLDQLHQELRESYGIKENSKEEKEIDLLRKSKDFSQELSKDEISQLESMGGLTEYQKEVLSLDKIRNTWEKIIRDGNNEISASAQTVEAMSLELLKSHPMVDAQKTAQDLLHAASQEQIGELIEQVKDRVDENLDEIDKKKEEEQDQKKDAVDQDSSNHSVEEKQISNASQEIQQDQVTQVANQDKVEAFIQKLGILEEDVKGLQVNKKI